LSQPISPFLLPSEVSEIVPLCKVTLWRLEKRGPFPRRVKLTGKKYVYHRREIDEWSKDPEGWRARHAPAAMPV
jgi:predicted DNA-binding transcriptional regulator AlpA